MALLKPHMTHSLLRGLQYIIVGLCMCTNAHAYASSPRELKIEAAYLYNFLNYITFPQYQSPEQKTHATLCIYGREALLPYMEYLRQRKKEERAITIRNLSAEGATECDMLYIGPNVSNWRGALGTVRNPQILTIGLRENFLEEGGMIELHHQQERIAMSINKSRIEEQGYSVSSRLLVLAQKVQQ